MLARPLALLAFVLALALALPAPGAVSPAPATVEKLADGIILPVGGGWLRLTVCMDDTIRVSYAKDHAFAGFRPSLIVVLRQAPVPAWNLTTAANTATLATARCQARVDLTTGAITFLDAAGQVVLAERAGGRSLDPATVEGEQTFHARQQWESAPDESLHGLGQQQLGIIDIKGYDLDLWQRNSVVVVPFLISSRGYGLLWDNPGYSRFGDLRPFEAIPAASLLDVSGQPGGLTTGTFTANAPDTLQGARVTADLTRGAAAGRAGRGGATTTRWVGEVVAPTTGDYQFQTYSNGGIKVWLDNQLIINRWRQGWLTEYDQVKIHLEAGKHYALKAESGGDQVSTMQLRWKTPAPAADASAISLWSEVGDGVDYYFVNGPDLDRVIAGYRQLTGAATMLPRWAFGLWQSYQRYETSKQSLDVVAGFRSRSIPFDNIVQDWQYWPENAWGSHLFDPARFPDPVAWIKSIHDQHVNLMISVWGKYYSGDYVGNENFKAMQAAGYLYQPTLTENIRDWVGAAPHYNYTFYDAFNSGARELFWKQINTALFQKGVDAWWMDASEPDVVQPSPPTLETTKHFIGTTALGSPSRVLNGYALENSRGIYEGQRATAPDQRVFILTRSGFAGQQRYSAITWSGDITSTWMTMAKEITAGLGFSAAGNPYWTMDTGGYTMENRFSNANITPANREEWYELNARWFEFSAFTAFLRVHGEVRPREMWTMGGESHPAYQAELKFDRLRYALLPYIYSLAGAVTQDGGTIMRPLVMDFRTDAKARELTDQYMFGPAFLVSPVTTYQARTRSVYLPATPGGWYDFWTGQAQAGGATLDAPAPLDAMPLHIRAGAIIPFGPELQYTGEKPADPITLRVYAGADGAFSLYEDDGLTNGYEKSQFSRIPIRWNNTTRTLSFGARTGSFPGMLAAHTFQIVLVTPDKPAAFSLTSSPSQTVSYNGAAQSVRLAP